ncbi:MAG: hypothetical protein OCC46_08055 [Pseudodesulfovibrio sp.]
MAKKKAGKMFESKFDENKLRSMIVEEGKSADEIQKELGIASKQSLRQHVLKLINIDRQFYDVPGLYVRNQKMPMINFKGELRLTKKMLDDGNFKHGDKFEIEQMDNSKIILARIGAEAASAETEVDVESDPEATSETY